ncbi:MAG: rhodanese-like domain-containing protein [Burkholderiaceae bacterium]
MSGVRFVHPTLDELPETILARAAIRGRDKGVPYAGLVTPIEAYALMLAGAATLVDVRTRFENEYVGRVPDTPLIEWKTLGAAHPNPTFLDQLEALEGKRENLLFLCRSGVRSHAAAMVAAEAGYAHAYDILEGFEGNLDAAGHRGNTGWRHAGLPWVQG